MMEWMCISRTTVYLRNGITNSLIMRFYRTKSINPNKRQLQFIKKLRKSEAADEMNHNDDHDDYITKEICESSIVRVQICISGNSKWIQFLKSKKCIDDELYANCKDILYCFKFLILVIYNLLFFRFGTKVYSANLNSM